MIELLITSDGSANGQRAMPDPAEHGLVVKALCDGEDGCLEWDGSAARRVVESSDMQGLTPRYIKRRVIEFIRTNGESAVEQRPETRENWKDKYKYWYKIILPEHGFKRGVFVEIILSWNDPDFPELTIVNAHPELRGPVL
jgi:hypothetical protein